MILSRELRSKLVRDSAYRRQFKSNPKAEIKRVMGIDLGSKRVKVYESSETHLRYCLPQNPIGPGEADDVVRAIDNRARTDAGFKNSLLRNPRRALSDALGFAIPNGIKVSVYADSNQEVTVICPPDIPDGGGNIPPTPGGDNVWHTVMCESVFCGPGGGDGPFGTVVLDAWTGDPSTTRCDSQTYEMSVDDNCTVAGNGLCTSSGGCDGLPTPKF